MRGVWEGQGRRRLNISQMFMNISLSNSTVRLHVIISCQTQSGRRARPLRCVRSVRQIISLQSTSFQLQMALLNIGMG